MCVVNSNTAHSHQAPPLRHDRSKQTRYAGRQAGTQNSFRVEARAHRTLYPVSKLIASLNLATFFRNTSLNRWTLWSQSASVTMPGGATGGLVVPCRNRKRKQTGATVQCTSSCPRAGTAHQGRAQVPTCHRPCCRSWPYSLLRLGQGEELGTKGFHFILQHAHLNGQLWSMQAGEGGSMEGIACDTGGGQWLCTGLSPNTLHTLKRAKQQWAQRRPTSSSDSIFLASMGFQARRRT
jgi:hypothetical protein